MREHACYLDDDTGFVCCRWVHKKLVGTGETSETKLAEMLEVGVREVDGGHWHYRQLQSADRSTDLEQGFRYCFISGLCHVMFGLDSPPRRVYCLVC